MMDMEMEMECPVSIFSAHVANVQHVKHIKNSHDLLCVCLFVCHSNALVDRKLSDIFFIHSLEVDVVHVNVCYCLTCARACSQSSVCVCVCMCFFIERKRSKCNDGTKI